MKTQQKKKRKRQSRNETLHEKIVTQHPELKRDNPVDELEAVKGHFIQRDEAFQKKLRHRLEFLTDGIVAIIITIMVLEMPLPSEASVSYNMFLNAIGIFFLSFFLVASFWYEHYKLFSEAEVVSPKVAVINFAFLAVLALIPILTKWMMYDVNRLSVINFGVAYLIINFVKSLMFAVVLSEHQRDQEWHGPQLRFILIQFTFLFALNALLLYLSWQRPMLGLMLYIILPISSLILQMFVTRSGMLKHGKQHR